MKIAIDLNGVIRDIFLKTEQVYTKFFLEEKEEDIVSEYNEETEEWVEISNDDRFEYGLNLPVTSTNLIEHFKFKTQDELYNFFYVDFPMQIFGHSPSINVNTFNILNDLYVDLRDEHEITIISDEIGKSKPATLFFLSKYGCLIENINFYSSITLENTVEKFDVIVTSNPNLLLNGSNKTLIKVITTYNESLKSDYTIEDISGLENIIKQIKN